MIKTNELRLGNLFQDKFSKDYFKVLELTEGSVVFDYFTNKVWQAEPIELTEEILLKCGFYYDTDYLTFCIPTCTIQLDDYGSEGYMCIIFGEDLYLINNLHQLQNLYWCLCGKELNIEL